MQSGLWARFIRMLWHLNDLVFLGLLDPELVAVSWYRMVRVIPASRAVQTSTDNR